MNELEKEEKEAESVRPEEGQHRFPVGITFPNQKENWRLAGIILLLAGVLLAFAAPTVWETADTGETMFHHVVFAWYVGVSLAAVLLCLLEIRLPEAVRRVFGWVLPLATPWAVFYVVDLINDTKVLFFSNRRLVANYLCYLLVFALVYALCRRAWLTTLIGGGACLFFGIVNYFVIQFRGKPILPWDIQAVTTAFEVSGGYHYEINRLMALGIMVLALLTLACYRLESHQKKWGGWKAQLAERGFAFMLFAVLAIQIFPCDLLTDMGISVWAWNQKVSAEQTGVLTGFFANIQFVMVNKPENYSAAAVRKLGEEIDSWEDPLPLGNPEKDPTVIVVMSESLTDLQNVGNEGALQLNEDCQPFLHSLQGADNVIWGTAYSSVYGGDTCNSEYEFLTGNSLSFLPTGSKPYQQYVDHEQTALPSILKSQGYTCTALHPGYSTAWHRDTAYPYLGFDTFLSFDEYTYRSREHGLVSDESHYNEIIQQYENRQPGEKQFLFTVSIQNHGGYEKEDYPSTIHIEKVGDEAQASYAEPKYPQTEQYLTMLKKTDEATEKFFRYFEQQEDPVVILLFGDHWPNLEEEFAKNLLGVDTEELAFEDLMQEHKVPFVLWANYPIESDYIGETSLNYLSGLLLRAANLQGTKYTKFLENMRQEIPVINALGAMDKEFNLYRNGNGKLAETPPEEYALWFREYAILQYNNAFGGGEKQRALFTVPDGT